MLAAEARHAVGHDPDARKARCEERQLGQGRLELVRVVALRHEHDLRMHLDARLDERDQPAQRHRATRVTQHRRPQRGVRGMHRDVEGPQAFGDDPFEVRLGETRERREVAVEEREAIVVVLDVQRPSQALRQLVDEAELAVVVAGGHPVEHGVRELRPERHARRLVDGHLERHTASLDLEHRVCVVDELAVLDDVPRLHAVHRDQHVAGRETGAARRRVRLDEEQVRTRHTESLVSTQRAPSRAP